MRSSGIRHRRYLFSRELRANPRQVPETERHPKRKRSDHDQDVHVVSRGVILQLMVRRGLSTMRDCPGRWVLLLLSVVAGLKLGL